jgi:hypothetical protein
MSKIKFYFILLIATVVTISSCNKDDNKDTPYVPPKPFAEQYPIDIAVIEDYLKANYITVVNNPGAVNDQDITITKLDADHPTSIWDQKMYPLKSREVKLHGIVYKLYYLVLREGVGESPTNVDGAFVAYKGNYLSSVTESTVTTITSTFFEENKFPIGVDLYGYIRGWKEIFPQLKAGTYKSNPNGDGTVVYSDFGAAVMFIPSGLAYYNSVKGSIPAYSPLVFNVKLYEINRLDHEYYMSGQSVVAVPDGVKSFQEDIDGDGYMWTKNELQVGVTTNPDDTDEDGIPDFLDRDDDGDDYATQGEVKDASGKIYPFDKIPDCSGNQTDPDRKKRHLDDKCIKMNQ